MTLRRKLATRVGAVTLLFALLSAGLAGWASARGFRSVDERDATEDAVRVQRALEREIEQLGDLTRDWASWDDTLRYVATGDPAYEDSNLLPGTLETLELDGLAIADRDGTVIWSSGYDRQAGERTAIDPEVVRSLARGGALHAEDLEGGYLGPASLDGGPALVAALPITDSAETAPASGTFVMVRSLDEPFVSALGDRVQRGLTVEPPSDADVPATTVRSDHVLTRVGLRTVDGEMVADLVVRSPRQATAVGLRTIGWMSLVLLATVTLAGVATFVVIDRALVRRLVRTRDSAIALGEDGPARLDDDGLGDELSDLRAAINETVASLDAARTDLALRNTELAELARFRKDLIAMVSHELRAPLASIRGFAQTLEAQSDALDDERRDHLVERISANAERLNRMVNDLLLLASADDGQLPTTPAYVRLDEVAAELQDDLQATFATEIPADTSVVCDPDHLRRIIINLVNNAHAHGQAPVEVSASTTGDQVELVVRDHGPGVPEEFIPALFERFSQSPDALRAGAGGVGLGLSIVDALAEANGGSITYEDARPGARFTVALPNGLARRPVGAGATGELPRR